MPGCSCCHGCPHSPVVGQGGGLRAQGTQSTANEIGESHKPVPPCRSGALCRHRRPCHCAPFCPREMVRMATSSIKVTAGLSPHITQSSTSLGAADVDGGLQRQFDTLGTCRNKRCTTNRVLWRCRRQLPLNKTMLKGKPKSIVNSRNHNSQDAASMRPHSVNKSRFLGMRTVQGPLH